MANRIPNASLTQTGFGKYVMALLTRFGLHDAEVMGSYLPTHPIAGKNDWPSLLSMYRGITMHVGSIDFDSGTHHVQEVVAVLNHVHDILLRIVLKLLCYDGEYQPTMSEWQEGKKLDWVTPQTSAQNLGFREADRGS